MKKQDALDHFGKRALVCEAAGVTPQNFTQWGFNLSEQTASKLSIESRGLLSFDRSLYLKPRHETVDGAKYIMDMDVGLFSTMIRKLNRSKARFFIIDGEVIEILPWSDKKQLLNRFHNYPVYFKEVV